VKPAGPVIATDRYAILTVAGDVVTGNLHQEKDGLFVVDGGAVGAKIAPESVAAIRFPQVGKAEPAEGETEAKKVLVCTIGTRRGSVLIGTGVEFGKGTFRLMVEGKQQVAVRQESVVDVSFSMEGDITLVRRLLVWGTYSDREDEYRKTMEVVKPGLGTQWTIVEDFSTLDDNFARTLQRSGVLLIPEMERGTPDETQASKFKPMAESFLRRGGRIVMLGPTSNHIQFMKTAGLMDVQADGTHDGIAAKFTTDGKRIFRHAGESFTTTNSTYFYTMGSDLKGGVALADAGGAPIVGRKVGRGWVILMGMDYFEHNEGTVKVLIDALTFR